MARSAAARPAPTLQWSEAAAAQRVGVLGYPDGLEGEEIPFLARIIAVVDAYDAMPRYRFYGAARAHRQILE